MTPNASLVPSSLRCLRRLTGSASPNRTDKVGIFGTDLGSSFEHDGKVYFLFGDTWSWTFKGPTDNRDSVAWTRDTNPDDGLQLNFILDLPDIYKSPKLRESGGEISVGAYEVPIAGVSSGGQIYVFYSTGSGNEPCLDGGVDAFWYGPEGAVGTNWANPGIADARWHLAFPTMPPGKVRPLSPLVAVARPRGVVDVFMFGLDLAVATGWINPDINKGAWHAPFAITESGAARDNSPLAAVTQFKGALDVFWVCPDGSVATAWANPEIDEGRWHPPPREPSYSGLQPWRGAPGFPIAAVAKRKRRRTRRLLGCPDRRWLTRLV